MSANPILTPEELAECRAKWDGYDTHFADALHHAALLGARKLRKDIDDLRSIYTNKPASEYAGAWHDAFDALIRRMDTRYPLPVRAVPRRVTDSEGWSFEFRDDVLWLSMSRIGGFRPATQTIDTYIADAARAGRYADAALLCDLAANPTEEVK